MGSFFRLVCLGVLMSVADKPRSAAPKPTVATYELRTGDVVLQTSKSARSALIRRASASPYSHVGVIDVSADGIGVIEAIQPVSRTSWAVWRARGVDAKVTVIRAKHATPEQLAAVVAAAKATLGRPYDAKYEWGDERLYCSELVTKAFATVGIEAGQQQALSSLHLTDAEVKYAQSLGFSPEHTLVTPASIAADSDFEVVHSDFEP